jgi:hypothetical protein
MIWVMIIGYGFAPHKYGDFSRARGLTMRVIRGILTEDAGVSVSKKILVMQE